MLLSEAGNQREEGIQDEKHELTTALGGGWGITRQARDLACVWFLS